MKSRFFLPIGAFCLTLIGLSFGCGGDAGGQEDSEHRAGDLVAGGGEAGSPLTVHLDEIGKPKWKPVDFHQFTSKWFKYEQIMTAILPPPDHAWSPTLGVAPGAPHDLPYDREIAEGMAPAGFVDQSSFTPAEFRQGVYLAWMNVPRKDMTPAGSSPDFNHGPIIPNELFPIHVQIQYSRDGVLDDATSAFDVPALDSSPNAAPVDGYSHFPMWTNDSAGSYDEKNAAASYAWAITMVDAGGHGWHIAVPFEVR
jgi:hypothetical protein